jgi:hypothetical protein
MTETEYIILSNRVKIETIMNILRVVIDGKLYGVDTKKYRLATKALAKIQDELTKHELIEKP